MHEDSPEHCPKPTLFGSWAAVLRDVRTLALDLTAASAAVVRQVPITPIELLINRWGWVEDAVLREVKSQLARLDAPEPRSRLWAAPGARPGTERGSARLLQDLLNASIDASSTSSREELYRALLRHLVPDEARILAALADGTRYPLVHIQSRANGGRTVLANASTVGQAAGVRVPEAVNIYVTHLRALGLAEEGPADDSLAAQYDILLGEPALRRAEEERDMGRLGTRVMRRTLRVSPLGSQLWLSCQPGDGVMPDAGAAAASDADNVLAARIGFPLEAVYRASSNGASNASNNGALGGG